MSDSTHTRNKRAVWSALGSLASDRAKTSLASTNAVYHEDARWFGSHPINEARGADEIAQKVWDPLKAAMPDLERRDLLVAGGEHDGKQMVGTMGHLQGTFVSDWHGIPATGGVVHLRYGESHEIVDGKIACTHALWDMLDLIRQSGHWPVAPSLGAEGMWPGPAGDTGLALDRHDAEHGKASQKIVLRMHRALFDFDGKSVKSMSDQENQWSEDFLWYGPSGIGTTRGLSGFQAHHQIPFLRAFPDRGAGPDGHMISIGDGEFVVTGGWPSVVATHNGNDWCGMPATRKHIDMRVMDFYRVVGGRITENWVPIDMINIFLQMGVDVFARLAHLRGDVLQDIQT